MLTLFCSFTTPSLLAKWCPSYRVSPVWRGFPISRRIFSLFHFSEKPKSMVSYVRIHLLLKRIRHGLLLLLFTILSGWFLLFSEDCCSFFLISPFQKLPCLEITVPFTAKCCVGTWYHLRISIDMLKIFKQIFSFLSNAAHFCRHHSKTPNIPTLRPTDLDKTFVVAYV